MGNQLKSAAVIASLKTLLFVFNILFWVLGLVYIVTGIWSLFELDIYMEMSPEFSGTAPHVLLGMGSLIVLLTTFAFSSIVRGHTVMLFIYGGFLAVIFMMKVGVGASVACYKDTFFKGLYTGLTHNLMTGNPHTNFDIIQSTMNCCGVSNYTDWVRLSRHRVIPTSCCISQERCVTANYGDVYQIGCYETITDALQENKNILEATAVAVASSPLIGSFFSCTLAKYLEKSKYDAIT